MSQGRMQLKHFFRNKAFNMPIETIQMEGNCFRNAFSQGVADSLAEIFQKMTYATSDNAYAKLLNQV